MVVQLRVKGSRIKPGYGAILRIDALALALALALAPSLRLSLALVRARSLFLSPMVRT